MKDTQRGQIKAQGTLAVILLMKYTSQKGWTKSPTKRSDIARIVKLKTAPATRLHLFSLHQ